MLLKAQKGFTISTMESTISINNPFIPGNSGIRGAYINNIPVKETEPGSVFEKLVSEGGENFINYFRCLGLSNDQNLIVLSSSHHYYYDPEELKEIKTVLNLKLLNQIRQLKDFLHNIYHIIPDKSNFIGSFIDGKHQRGFFSGSGKSQKNTNGKSDPVENKLESAIPFINMIYDIIDLRTNRYITRRTATILLEETGLAVTNMTELKGITYFCTTKIPLRA